MLFGVFKKWSTYRFKGIVNPKMKFGWKCTQPHAIYDLDEFVSSSEQIWRNLALHHQLIIASSAVNGCRQNESPNSWYKHHNNPLRTHTTTVH